MLKKFLGSAYTKAAITILICGGLLILFHNWISGNRISLGFETINKTLAPVYIGVVFAFILCPVYNACVKYAYSRMLNSASGKGTSVGAMVVTGSHESYEATRDERRRMLTAARVFATLVSVVLVVGLFGLLIYFVVPQLVQNGIGLANTLPQRLAAFSEWLALHFSKFPQLSKWVDDVANAGTNDIIKWFQEHILSGNAVSIASMISSGVVTAITYVANIFVGLLIMVYLLNYKERLFAIIRKFIAATCGQKRQDRLYEFADVVNETFIGFIVGRIIDSFIIGVLTYIVMKICGISFPLMISVIIGVTNIIPFFGPFIGAIPSIFLLLLERPIEAFYFLIIIVLIQQIDGNVIGPKIVGNAIGISSFWVLIAVLIGGGLFGFYGMALGVPVFAVIYRYVDKLTTRSLKNKNKDSETNDYFSLDVYGIEDKEISLNSEKKKEESLFKRLRKGNNRNLVAGLSARAEEKEEAKE
ncbi:MAG: AI-2E family transporter [Mogibacterium sp.]|nr:AI-2E family transporter [Mogibacterium sp.]